ncbi:SIR2 family protein [Rhizobium sp. 2YAF20]|uniref:SIR2 family protein n=1 Tax=Rhizobium sp. 2YAF20 TaxID=3233027 RepID=UPI003F9C2B4B
MFKHKTVFVVGAGGSKEVSLPTGDELRKIIIEKMKIGPSGFTDGNIGAALVEIYNRRPQPFDINPYIKAANQIAEAMPGALSIDNFLATHANNGHIVTLGKIAIASSILAKESTCDIRLNGEGKLPLGKAENYWMNTFCKLVSEEAVSEDLNNLFHDVSIITFNYDRCIEHFLAHYLSTYFLIDMPRALELSGRLRIIHPYGQVGNYPGRSENTAASAIPFGARNNAADLVNAVEQIHTFMERKTEHQVVATMRNVIAEANHIVFLGFAFADMNMELLIPESVAVPKTVFGTVLGLPSPTTQAIDNTLKSQFQTVNSISAPVHLAQLKANELLQHYWHPIFK